MADIVDLTRARLSGALPADLAEPDVIEISLTEHAERKAVLMYIIQLASNFLRAMEDDERGGPAV